MKLLNNFRWYRKWRGGRWYKHRTITHLPGDHTEFWSKDRNLKYFTTIQKIEYYRK
jgi:hypothetical protein